MKKLLLTLTLAAIFGFSAGYAIATTQAITGFAWRKISNGWEITVNQVTTGYTNTGTATADAVAAATALITNNIK